MQSLQNMKFDDYGYSTGSPYGAELMNGKRGPNSVQIGDQGLSPPYSNQSPPHSVQSSLTLSPQGYIGNSI